MSANVIACLPVSCASALAEKPELNVAAQIAATAIPATLRRLIPIVIVLASFFALKRFGSRTQLRPHDHNDLRHPCKSNAKNMSRIGGESKGSRAFGICG